MTRSAVRVISAVVVLLALNAGSSLAVASTTKVNFGDISHKGLKNLGSASPGLKLSLQLGMIANQQGIANAMKAASNPTSLTPANTIASSGVWNDTAYPKPYEQTAAGGGGVSTFEKRPWWQPAISSQKAYRMVPDVAAFADPSPGYAIICSSGVQSCPSLPGQTISFVGGTSAAAPLVAGMIALWDQQAKQSGLPRPGFVPPLLYSIAHHAPGSFLDITTGGNSVFSNVSCCAATPGFDLASGLGSPLANEIVNQLHH
jgi:hypothetical protein